jgi:hypothetical protein
MWEQWGKIYGLESTAAPKKVKIGAGPFALPTFDPTCHEHGTGHRGLGRNRGGAGTGDETQRGLGGGEIGWDRDSVPAIPCLCLTNTAKRQRFSSLASQPPPANANGEIGPPDPSLSDPFKNLREQREKKEQSGFEYDPFSINKNLID